MTVGAKDAELTDDVAGMAEMDDFYEDDEPIEKVMAITSPPADPTLGRGGDGG